MAEPSLIVGVSLKAVSLIRRYWKEAVVVLFIISMIPVFILVGAINILFPQIEKEDFTTYKELSKETQVSWQAHLAYDVVRLENYLKENNPKESIFDFLVIDFIEYEIIEKEKEVIKTVDGKEVTETIIEKEYVIVRELKANGYFEIQELLKSLDYDITEDNMSVQKVTLFLEELGKKEEYDIQVITLTTEEISDHFEDSKKEWFFALIEILPIIDPTSEFDPDKFIIPDLSSNPSVPSIWPTQGRVTSEFGEIRQTHIHKGIDIANTEGTPIYSTADGQVIAVGSSGNFGKRIMIYHGTDKEGRTYVTIYAHLSQFKVGVGDKVSQGDLIGLMGNTGYSTGPHLHYEVMINGVSVNPRYFLP